MDTSSNDNNTNINRMELEILIIASIQSLKRNNKKCGNEEVFELVLEFWIILLIEVTLMRLLRHSFKTKKLR